MKRFEKGFTLVEMLVAMSVVTLVAGAAGGGMYQAFRNTERNTNQMTALMQVQNFGNRIEQDIRIAQYIETEETLDAPNFAYMKWIEVDTNNEYEITYSLEAMDEGDLKKLVRTEVLNDTYTKIQMVSQYIVTAGSMTTCNLTDGIFNLQVSATIGEGSTAMTETRTYRIFPRPG